MNELPIQIVTAATLEALQRLLGTIWSIKLPFCLSFKLHQLTFYVVLWGGVIVPLDSTSKSDLINHQDDMQLFLSIMTTQLPRGMGLLKIIKNELEVL